MFEMEIFAGRSFALFTDRSDVALEYCSTRQDSRAVSTQSEVIRLVVVREWTEATALSAERRRRGRM